MLLSKVRKCSWTGYLFTVGRPKKPQLRAICHFQTRRRDFSKMLLYSEGIENRTQAIRWIRTVCCELVQLVEFFASFIGNFNLAFSRRLRVWLEMRFLSPCPGDATIFKRTVFEWTGLLSTVSGGGPRRTCKRWGGGGGGVELGFRVEITSSKPELIISAKDTTTFTRFWYQLLIGCSLRGRKKGKGEDIGNSGAREARSSRGRGKSTKQFCFFRIFDKWECCMRTRIIRSRISRKKYLTQRRFSYVIICT